MSMHTRLGMSMQTKRHNASGAEPRSKRRRTSAYARWAIANKVRMRKLLPLRDRASEDALLTALQRQWRQLAPDVQRSWECARGGTGMSAAAGHTAIDGIPNDDLSGVEDTDTASDVTAEVATEGDAHADTVANTNPDSQTTTQVAGTGDDAGGGRAAGGDAAANAGQCVHGAAAPGLDAVRGGLRPAPGATMHAPAHVSARSNAETEEPAQMLAVSVSGLIIGIGLTQDSDKGGVITIDSVEPGSEAEALGIKVGMQIVRVGSVRVNDLGGVQEVADAVRDAARPVVLHLNKCSNLDSEGEQEAEAKAKGGEEERGAAEAQEEANARAEGEKEGDRDDDGHGRGREETLGLGDRQISRERAGDGVKEGAGECVGAAKAEGNGERTENLKRDDESESAGGSAGSSGEENNVDTSILPHEGTVPHAVVLVGQPPNRLGAQYMGVYELMHECRGGNAGCGNGTSSRSERTARTVNGNPVYSHASLHDCRIFYGTSGNWCVGNESSVIDGQGKGWWTVRSDAPTPDLIRGTWKCFSGDAKTVAAAVAMNGAAQPHGLAAQRGLAALGLGQGWVDVPHVKALAVSEAKAAASEVETRLSKQSRAASTSRTRAQAALSHAQVAVLRIEREAQQVETRLEQARSVAASALRTWQDAALREQSSQQMQEQAGELLRAIAAVTSKQKQSSAHLTASHDAPEATAFTAAPGAAAVSNAVPNAASAAAAAAGVAFAAVSAAAFAAASAATSAASMTLAAPASASVAAAGAESDAESEADAEAAPALALAPAPASATVHGSGSSNDRAKANATSSADVAAGIGSLLGTLGANIGFSCAVCLEDKAPGTRFKQAACGHSFCLQCDQDVTRFGGRLHQACAANSGGSIYTSDDRCLLFPRPELCTKDNAEVDGTADESSPYFCPDCSADWIATHGVQAGQHMVAMTKKDGNFITDS